ncbi:MAG: NFACT family protein [Methanobacteriota archaeon]|nr:MAG: NFACT family protein [Euryarchaeota archaeon]
MKKALSSFDVAAIVNELQRCVGWRIDKAYQPAPRHLVLAARSPHAGKEFLHFRVGEWIYVTASADEMPREPSDFAMMLRKRILNAAITGIRQQGFDRIVVIDLEKDERYQLILELFGKGNVILVNKGFIVQPLTSRAWRHRDVRAKRPFEFPPPIPDPSWLDAPELLSILSQSDADLVRTLATKLNLGGTYSEEICRRANVMQGKPAGDATEEEAAALTTAISDVAAEARTSRRGFVVTRKGGQVDVTPLRMSIYDAHDIEEFSSFSESIEEYVRRMPPPSPKKTKATDGKDHDIEKLKRKLVQQEEAAVSLQNESVGAQAAGDAMYAKYGDIAHILMMARDKLSQANALDDLPGFLSFDKRKGLLRVEIDSAVYELDVNGTVESNAQRYYEKGKKMKGKLEGVLPALEETRNALTEWKRDRERAEARSAPKAKPTKRFWFERFRWFVSSEGAIVLGGKDARTNDMLVKKHLEAGDRYAHADVHGAPSIVVKMREGVTEATLMEACEFAVATSKAWNAGIGSAAGYWVLPEQVSKTPQSGEFLARGAFVIRGKRNYAPKTEIRLGIGEMTYEGERKVMCGPVSAVKRACTRHLVIKPGDIEKNLFAKRLAEEFNVPIEEVQSVLPPGDLEIVERSGTSLEISAS